jgi:hydroxymethylglutaryl-CoA lyase
MTNVEHSVWQGAGRRLHIQEVGMRDGLQMEQAFVPTEDKIALVNALSDAGLAKIEVSSFVSPSAIPALRDAEIVLREITRRPGTVYSALVPNVRGAERAIEARTDEMNLVMSASATHNLANLRMTQAQSFAALAQVAATAQAANVAVNVSLSCVFGCPMEGDVAMEAVFDWVQRFVDLGVAGLGILALPNYMAQAHLAQGELVALLQDWRLEPMPLYVAFPPNRNVSAKLRVFIDWVVELLADHAPAARP